MKDRLAGILKHYKLNSSRLAEMIDVQRSGISHILSGRNNPSYDFLIRILDTFPEINANWLLTGRGEMVIGNEESHLFTEKESLNKDSVPIEKVITSDTEQTDPNELQISTEQNSYKSKQSDLTNTSIDKVIILYSDGKFKDYRQE